MLLQVLYNLCEWPSRKGSRLAVIGIANTLDLPERLMPRIASRLGGRRVVFQPYKREQLQEIVIQRLKDAGVSEAFDDNAVKYAASKVHFKGREPSNAARVACFAGKALSVAGSNDSCLGLSLKREGP